MHVITIPEGISEPIPVQGGIPMQAGKEYICTNAFAGLMMLSRWRVVIDGGMWSLRLLMKVRPIVFFPFDPTKDWNEKHIWLYRGGGFGDLLMLTPLIRELKERWPKCVVHVACAAQHYPQFYGIDVELETIPIPLETRDKIDCLVDFEETVEGNPAAEHLHMAQLFASRMGIALNDLKPEYHLKLGEVDWAWSRYAGNGLPRIGIQFMASAFYRSYPDMGKVLLSLSKKAQVFLFGAPNQVVLKDPVTNIVNLMEDKITYRESSAVASTCKVCLSPDSAMVHLCSALNIPCVGLYGPFPSELRVTSDLCHPFDGVAHCAPCFFHAEAPDQFPAGMPCTEKKRCVALESISPELVTARVLSLAEALESPG